MLTVGELAKLTGVTVRTLHHYDEIGLVRPSGRTQAGYRLYDDDDVLRLHQVLTFREVGLPLDAIADVLAGDADELLARHREVLLAKRERLDAMIAALDSRLGGKTMTNDDIKTLFDGFDPAHYDDEACEKWGDTDAYKESARRTKQYTKADWERYKAAAAANHAQLVALMRAGTPVADPAVRDAVEEHRLLIDRWFYPCSTAIHRGLAKMYVDDPRFAANLDKLAPGFARYLSDAILG